MALSHVVIINDSSRARGGATGLAVLGALGLRERGLQVTFVCGDGGDVPELEAQGVEVIAAGSGRLLQRSRGHAMRRGIYDPEMRGFVEDAVRRTDGPRTVYHLHGWAQILSPSVFDALAPVAGKTVVHAHDMFLACPNGVYMDYRRHETCPRVPLSAACLLTNCDKRSYGHKLWRSLRQRALFRAFGGGRGWGRILAIHPGMVPRLARAGYTSPPLSVLRNPATPFSDERVQAERNRSLVYVGRLEADKGVIDLARAASRVGAELVFVGDGVLRDRLEAEFPGIRITGWLSRAEIGQWVSQARSLVMPSHHPEPFALVLAEAAASGLPVAVAKTALMAEEIVVAGLGVAFDVFDTGDFDAALRRLVDMNETDAEAMSRRGWSGEVRLALTRSEWLDQLVESYDTVLSQD